MFQLIFPACLAASSGVCAPIVLAEGEARDQAGCEAGAARIAARWLAERPDLRAGPPECRATESLPALALREIAPGVHVHEGEPVQLEDSAAGRIANLGVIVGTASVAVVDAGVSRQQGQELFAAIRRLTSLPVSHVILTHMHPDHVLGASVFREAGAEVVGHAALPMALQARAETYLDALARLYPAAAMLGTEVVQPDRTVAEELLLDLGDRRLRLRAAPVAHTDNDLTVFDEATGTFFAGDLVFRDLTPVIDGSLAGWLAWMATPPDPAPQMVVPGHGPVSADWHEATAPQGDFLKALAGTTRARIAAGIAMSDAVPLIVSDLKDMAESWNAFPETAARDATAAYKELEWE